MVERGRARGSKKSENHAMRTNFENITCSIVVEICDPGHWIDDEFWKQAYGEDSECPFQVEIFTFDRPWQKAIPNYE